MKFSELNLGDRIMEGGSNDFATVVELPRQISDGAWQTRVQWDGGFYTYIRNTEHDTYYLMERIAS